MDSSPIIAAMVPPLQQLYSSQNVPILPRELASPASTGTLQTPAKDCDSLIFLPGNSLSLLPPVTLSHFNTGDLSEGIQKTQTKQNMPETIVMSESPTAD